MKKSLLVLLLSVFSIFSYAQTGGFVTINDFGLPNNTYQFTRFWIRGSIPQGTNPIVDWFGSSKTKFYVDTITIHSLAQREDPISTNKLVWIDTSGMLRAFTPSYLTNITSSQVTGALGYTPFNPSGTASQYVKGDGTLATFPSIPASQVNSDWNSASGVSQILNKPVLATVASTGAYTDLTGKPTIPAAQVNCDWNATSGITQILNKPTLPLPDYISTTTTSGTSGNAVFYLTSDGTSGGTALYTTVDIVIPIVNDATQNYTYGWTVSGDKKTLTVNSKVASGINVGLLGLTLLGVPANVAAGTSVSVLVKGH